MSTREYQRPVLRQYRESSRDASRTITQAKNWQNGKIYRDPSSFSQKIGLSLRNTTGLKGLFVHPLDEIVDVCSRKISGSINICQWKKWVFAENFSPKDKRVSLLKTQLFLFYLEIDIGDSSFYKFKVGSSSKHLRLFEMYLQIDPGRVTLLQNL